MCINFVSDTRNFLQDGSFLGLPMYICPCSKLVIKQIIIQDVSKGISTLASKMVNHPGISLDTPMEAI
jgi:hypothetical protein